MPESAAPGVCRVTLCRCLASPCVLIHCPCIPPAPNFGASCKCISANRRGAPLRGSGAGEGFYTVSNAYFRLCRDRRACPDPLALPARLDQWVRLEKMADPDLLEPQARRALPDSREQQANLECLGLLGRRARWARMVPTVCRVPREPWGLKVSRVSRVLRASWAHQGSQASQVRPASTACLALRARPVSEEPQEPTGLVECLEPTVHRELPARVALLVLRAPPARPEPLAPLAHMARGMVITTVAECCGWNCRGFTAYLYGHFPEQVYAYRPAKLIGRCFVLG
jgi:hypothetical protein